MFGRNIYRRLTALIAIVVGVLAFGAAQASASSAPVVIAYHKTCDASGHCFGSAGNGGTIEMWITSFRATGDAAQLTLRETIKSGNISFTAVMNGTMSPAGFIVLNGTVTDGTFAGAQIHQRSNYDSGPADASVWNGELQLLPASS